MPKHQGIEKDVNIVNRNFFDIVCFYIVLG